MDSGEQRGPDGGPPRGRFTIVYLIHEAFRRDLARLSSAVRGPRVDQQRARRLSAHWEFVNDQLHHHHEVEDASLWPLVRPKLSGRNDELAVLSEMEAQHVALVPQCEAIGVGFSSFATKPDEHAGAELGDELDSLASQLESHLNDEEVRCFPVIDQALSVRNSNPSARRPPRQSASAARPAFSRGSSTGPMQLSAMPYSACPRLR